MVMFFLQHIQTFLMSIFITTVITHPAPVQDRLSVVITLWCSVIAEVLGFGGGHTQFIRESFDTFTLWIFRSVLME